MTPEALRLLLRAAWQDGWQQRSNLHVAPLGKRIVENKRRCDAYVEAVIGGLALAEMVQKAQHTEGA